MGKCRRSGNVGTRLDYSLHLLDGAADVFHLWRHPHQFIFPASKEVSLQMSLVEMVARLAVSDAGHFVLETNLEEIAGLILPFLEKHLK